MRIYIGAVTLAVLTLAAVPSATVANHGLDALYESDDGTVVYAAAYVSGDGDAQTWLFVGTGGACQAFGSIEVGFVGDCVVAGGTGHFHPYTGCDPDFHAVTINGLAGTVTVDLVC